MSLLVTHYVATILCIHSFVFKIGCSTEWVALDYLDKWNYKVTWFARRVFTADYASKEVVAKAFFFLGVSSFRISGAVMLFVIIG